MLQYVLKVYNNGNDHSIIRKQYKGRKWEYTAANKLD